MTSQTAAMRVNAGIAGVTEAQQGRGGEPPSSGWLVIELANASFWASTFSEPVWASCSSGRSRLSSGSLRMAGQRSSPPGAPRPESQPL
jgi:hypothetical protein